MVIRCFYFLSFFCSAIKSKSELFFLKKKAQARERRFIYRGVTFERWTGVETALMVFFI